MDESLVSPSCTFTHCWLDAPDPAAPPPIRWLWTGYLAVGRLTLLTSLWKSGKTTLTSLLLARMKTGGRLADQDVQPGKALVVSEESPDDWRQRAERLDLAGHVCLISRPFVTPPTPTDWLRLLDHLAALHRAHAFQLLVIDPLASLLPAGSELHAGAMLAALLPLRTLLDSDGLAGLLLHHPAKKDAGVGRRARGTGALAGQADILLELEYLSAPESADRRRLLLGCARQPTTPRRRVIELNAEGTDYGSLGDLDDVDFTHGWLQLEALLVDADQKLTRRDFLAAWPADVPVPPPTTLHRWLTRAVEQGQLRRDGTGRKNNPFRYWLPGQELRWDARFPLWRTMDESARTLREQGLWPDMPGAGE